MIRIIKATYGGKDCTAQIAAKVKGDSFILRSNNGIIGDPMVGTRKTLNIELEDGGIIHRLSALEGNLIVYPKDKHDRVGIFYSNNSIPEIYPAIRASLASIKKAAEGIADVYTCMWKHEEENPFPEYIAWTQHSSHLNQLLQIMQLLYSAREIYPYKFVSFLEHDVLYPEGYFDYPPLNPGEVLTNMNYMGMNKNGFQTRGQNDEPFHQMTMNFDEAIKHCESILPNALVTNAGLIETQTMKRSQWICKNPSVHINHGSHFTSHYNVYRKGGEQRVNNYWGEFDKYKHLFH